MFHGAVFSKRVPLVAEGIENVIFLVISGIILLKSKFRKPDSEVKQ